MADNDQKINVAIGATNNAKSVLSGAIADFSNFWRTASGGNDAKGAAANLENLGSKAGISNRALLGVGVAGGVAAAGAVAIAAGAIKAATNFQELTTQLVTGAGESEKELDTVRSGILKISSATGDTATSLAQGMFLIESAGYRGAAALDVMKVAAQGAKVGGADLSTTSDALTTVMHDYGIAADHSAVAMNFLTSTVASGKMHMQDLAGSMGKILPTASSLHVPLNQVGAAIASLTAAGSPAARATTALNQTMLQLVHPSSAAKKTLIELGLTSTQVGNTLTHEGLQQALQLITDHLSKKFPAGSAEYMNALATISGGTKGLTGVLGVTGQNMSTFIDNIKSISGESKKAGNSVMGWSTVQKDQKTKMDEAKASIENAKIAIGEGLLPAVTTITSAISKILQPISSWIASHSKISGVILGSIGVFGALAVGVTLVTAAVGALDVAALPWIALAMAIAAAGYEIVQQWKKIEPSLRPLINIFNKDVLPVLREVYKVIMGQLKIAFNDIKESFDKVAKAIAPHKRLLADIGKLLLIAIVTPVALVVAAFVGLIAILAAVVAAGARLSGWLSEIIGWFVRFAFQMEVTVHGAIRSVEDGIKKLPNNILGAIVGFGSLLINAGGQIIGGLLVGIERGADALFNKVKSLGTRAVNALKGVLKIFSPSQVFADIGSNIGAGLVKGIQGTEVNVTHATTKLGTAAIVGGKSGATTASNISNNNISNNSTKQNVTIQNLTLQMPNGATMESFLHSLDRDTQLTSMGASPARGVI